MNYEQIKRILIDVINDNHMCIEEKSRLYEDLGLCSYDMMLVIEIIENEYKKKVDLNILLEDMTIRGLMKASEWGEGYG